MPAIPAFVSPLCVCLCCALTADGITRTSMMAVIINNACMFTLIFVVLSFDWLTGLPRNLLNLDFLPIRFCRLWSNTQSNAHALTKHLGTSEIPHIRRAKLPILYGKSRWSLRKSQRTGPDFEGMPIAICAVAHVWTGVRSAGPGRDGIEDEDERT